MFIEEDGKRLMRRLLSRCGLDIQRSATSDLAPRRLARALQHHQVDTVLDVGANVGRFAEELRQAGFEGRLVSFEPLSDAHEQLVKHADRDPEWFVHPRCAVGDENGRVRINRSQNLVSSSILPLAAMHRTSAPQAEYSGAEDVDLVRIDHAALSYIGDSRRVCLKIDAQGYEWPVWLGATGILPRINGLVCEVSLVELYEGQYLWKELMERFEAAGFSVWSVDRGFTDKVTGRTLQLDIAMFRAVRP